MTAVNRSWPLVPPTHDELHVLAECWAVPLSDLLTARPWVQATGAGDAPGPRVVQFSDRTVTVLESPGGVSHQWVPRMTGLRGLMALPARSGPLPLDLAFLTEADLGAVRGLHDHVDAADLTAAAPSPDEAALAVGAWDQDGLMGIAAVEETPSGPPEVSILVDPAYRRQGLALRLEQALIAAAGGRWKWLQHRTIDSDSTSQSLAARCGFRLVSIEHLVRAVG